MKHKLYNRLLSLALAVGLVAGMLPGMTFAGAVDTTAPQSQAEQIAEPTEEPEANDAPQAEPRINTDTFDVYFVDARGSEIQPSDTYTLNRSNTSYTIRQIAGSFGGISGYTFAESAYIDREWWQGDIYIQQVRYQNRTLMYNDGESWKNWPSSIFSGAYPLVLVYEKNEEPEPTPEPTPTPDPSGDLWIEDDIIDTGRFVAHIEEASAEQVDHYVWYRSESENGNYTEVARVKVTGDEYNVAAAADDKGNWVNVAYDRLYQENNNELDTTMRYWYKVAAVDTTGNTIATSEAEMVPYYFALQNGSFEVPQGSGSDDMMQQIPVSTNGLIWKTTGLGTGSHRNQDIEILNPFLNSRAAWDNYYLDNAYNTTTGVPDGNQVAELNCEAWGALYQDVLTVPLSTLNWQYYHRGRFGTNNRMDEMQLLIENLKDIEAGFDPAHGDQSGQSYFVDSSTANRSKWEYNSGSYEVPASQFVSRFYFTSVSSYNGTTDAANSTVGNLLDDVAFTTHPLDPTPDKGTLTVTKRVEGFETIPADYEVKITIRNGDYTASDTLTAYEFTAAGEGVFTATASFNNIDPGQYTITEEVTGVPDGYDKNEQEQTAADVVADTITPATLTNTYTEDTSDEYPVRFYLEGIKTHQVTENYTFTDEWAKLNADLIGGFANVTSTLYGGEGYPNLNGEQGYDSAVTGGSVPGGIQGHSNVETWLEKYKCAPNIDTDNIANVLDDLIKMYPQIANVPVTVVGNEEYTVSEIKQTLQTDPDAFQIVYTQVTKNHDAITEHFRGNGSVTDGQDSYHVHLSIRKNPGDLTVTKTFAGLEADQIPSEFAIQVKASNGTLIDTLSLNEATLKDDTYTWTLENLNEDTYTVTETGTDVENMVLSATINVTDNDTATPETVNKTTAKVKVADNETSTVAITNTYTLAEQTLKVYKNLSGFANEGKPVFSFKIWDLETDDVWYYHIDMTNKTLNQDEPVIELTLPAGHEYRVEELSNQNYRFVKLEQDGTVINPLQSRALLIPTGGDITLEKDTKLVFYNDPVNSNIPTDGGATENTVTSVSEGVITWKQEPDEYGKDPNHNNINPNDEPAE